MASVTSNYKFIKPTDDSVYDISYYSDTLDAIDAAIKEGDDALDEYRSTMSETVAEIAAEIAKDGYTIKQVTSSDAELTAGIYYVAKEAATNMPVAGYGYITTVFDEYNLIDGGSSSWKMIAVNLETGKIYCGTSSIDSSYNDILANSISWTELNKVSGTLSATSTSAVQSKVIYAALANKASKSVATTSSDGLMSAEDKEKLEGLSDTGVYTLEPVQIGEWYDGTPMWRVVIEREVTSTEAGMEGYVSLKSDMPASDIESCFFVRAFVMICPDSGFNYTDTIILGNVNHAAANFELPSVSSSYTGYQVRAIMEFVTPESNVKG